jgi:hypothetical protein
MGCGNEGLNMPKCAKCEKTTFDGTRWKSTTSHPEFNEKYLCKKCLRELSSESETTTVSQPVAAGRGYGVYALLGILLLVSACLVLAPSIGALLNASKAVGYYGSSYGVSSAFSNAAIQVMGQVLLFAFLGVALYRMYSIDREAKTKVS